jgi:hypothetical protein
MIQPEALKKNDPLVWSPGMGADVWEHRSWLPEIAVRQRHAEKHFFTGSNVRRAMGRDITPRAGNHEARSDLGQIAPEAQHGRTCQKRLRAVAVLVRWTVEVAERLLDHTDGETPVAVRGT